MGAEFSLLRALQQPFDRIVNPAPSPPARTPTASASPSPSPQRVVRRRLRLQQQQQQIPSQPTYCDRSTWLNTLRNRSNISANRHVMLARLAYRLGHMRTCRRIALIQQLNLSNSLLSEMRKYLKRNTFVAQTDWVDDWHTLSTPTSKRRLSSSQTSKSVSFAQYAELRFFHA